MKKLILLLLLIPVLAYAQDDKKHFQVGAGYSFGFFSPSDVNDYINNRINEEGVTIIEGTSDMFMNIGGRLFVGYKTNFNLGFEAFLEGALGPKSIQVSGGNDMTFMFNRLSPGLKLTYDLELGRRSSLIFGAGIMHNRLKFKEDGEELTSASSWGTKFSVAYQLNFRHIAPRVFVDVDLAKAKDKEKNFEMNYSGVQIGMAFSGVW